MHRAKLIFPQAYQRIADTIYATETPQYCSNSSTSTVAETGGVKMVIWDIEGTFFKDDLQNKIRLKTFVFIKDYWTVSRIEQTSILVFSACISFRFGFFVCVVLCTQGFK